MTLSRRFDRSLRELSNVTDIFGMDLLRPLRTYPNYSGINLDVVETEADFTLKVPLPGLTKEDMNISITNGTLEINAEAKPDTSDETKYVYRGVSTSKFNKTLPRLEEQFNIDPKKIVAKYINGVLEISMPKKKAATVKTISIEIEWGNFLD